MNTSMTQGVTATFNFYQQIFDNSPFPIIVIDSHLKVIETNKTVLKFLDESKENILGRSAFWLLQKVKINTSFLHSSFHEAWHSEAITRTTFVFQDDAHQEAHEGEMLLQKLDYNGQEALCIVCKEHPNLVATYEGYNLITQQDILALKGLLREVHFEESPHDAIKQVLHQLQTRSYTKGSGYYVVNHHTQKAYLEFNHTFTDKLIQHLFELDIKDFAKVLIDKEICVYQKESCFQGQEDTLVFLPVEYEGTLQYIILFEVDKHFNKHLSLFNILAVELNRLLNQSYLVKARKIAEKNLDIKRQFFANMNHEIRTPMNGLIGMIEMLGDTYLTPYQKDIIQTMKRSSETLLSILNDILILSKLEVGKVELKPHPVFLDDLLERLHSLFLHQASIKNSKLVYKIQRNTHQYVNVDETRLLQILSNLVSNAIKFTENGFIKIMVSELPNFNKDNKKLKFEVIDTGIGISEENQSMLFDSFYQIDNAYQKSYNGTGLGLAISKELCQLMNGEIGVTSKLGEGSTFWFTVVVAPCTAKDVVSSQLKENSLQQYLSFTNAPKILVVDDTQTNLTVSQHILQKANCEVMLADSGHKAIELVKKQTFDLILMDIQMPVMNGIEATKEIRRLLLNCCPPILAMSAFSQVEEQETFIREGLDDCVAKPVKPVDLIQKIHQWLDPSQKGKEKKLFATTKQTPFSLARLSELPMFNTDTVASLKVYTGEEFWLESVGEFCKEAQEALQEADAALRKQEYTTIKNCFHKLKGSSGMIGLERLQRFMEYADGQAKQQDFSQIAYYLAVAKQLLREVLQAMETKA